MRLNDTLKKTELTLLEIRGDDHTKEWCELVATVSTPVFSVMLTLTSTPRLCGIHNMPFCVGWVLGDTNHVMVH